MKYFSVLLGIAFFAASCTKEKIVTVTNNVPTPQATIHVLHPLENDSFHKGDVVHIMATVSAPNTLHGYALSIRNETMDDAEVFYTHLHMHGSTLTIDTSWVSNVTTPSDMSVTVTAMLDHEGESESKEVAFRCIP